MTRLTITTDKHGRYLSTGRVAGFFSRLAHGGAQTLPYVVDERGLTEGRRVGMKPQGLNIRYPNIRSY